MKWSGGHSSCTSAAFARIELEMRSAKWRSILKQLNVCLASCGRKGEKPQTDYALGGRDDEVTFEKELSYRSSYF